DFPVIDNDELAKIVRLGGGDGTRRTHILKGLYRFDRGPHALEQRLEELCREADEALAAGAQFLVLSDRNSNKDRRPIPSLLFVSAVHHHPIRQETRMRVGLIVETGDAREVHHAALLLGYGASAINPYLAMETAEQLVATGYLQGVEPEKAVKN